MLLEQFYNIPEQLFSESNPTISRPRRRLLSQTRRLCQISPKPPSDKRNILRHSCARCPFRGNDRPNASLKEASTIVDDAPEKTWSRTAADRRKIRSEKEKIHREQRAVPRGIKKGGFIHVFCGGNNSFCEKCDVSLERSMYFLSVV